MHGRYKQPARAQINGVIHITGGGIQGNIDRILKKRNLKIKNLTLPEPHPVMKKLMELGNVSKEEAYQTWNMGVGMVIISPEAEEVQGIAEAHGIKSQILGKIQ